MKSFSKRFFTTHRVSQPIRTTDGKMLTVKPASPLVGRWRFRDGTQDTVLNTPTPAEMAEWSRRMSTMSGCDLGLLWQGDLKPVGTALVAMADALRRVKGGARQKDALSKAVVALASFGNTLGTSEAEFGPADALAFPGSLDSLPDERPEGELSKASVGDSGGAQLRAWRDKTGNDVAAINKANADFWAQQPRDQHTPARALSKG